MNMSSDGWFDFFHSFFDKYQADIRTVLTAQGCREGWIQGQMFIHSRDDNFSVNTFSLNKPGKKVDIEGQRPFPESEVDPMIAEIKIVAPNFMQTDIQGWSNIDEFSSGETVNISEHHLNAINPKRGSILKDIVRLKSVVGGYRKLMILIIPVHAEDRSTNLGTALRNISLSNKVWEKKYVGFEVRIWDL